jgi:hypothetical protein
MARVFGLPGESRPQSFPFFARSSFCRQFALCKAWQTRVNQGLGFSSIYKMDYFVESLTLRTPPIKSHEADEAVFSLNGRPAAR